jgi:dUTP pyrophosphatase
MKQLKVKIEKTELAKKLEEQLGIKWELTQQHAYDAGYDLRACIDIPIALSPGRHTMIPTGMLVEMQDPHWEMQVRPRSGLAAKKNILVSNSPGTVDFSFRLEVQVIVFNAGREAFTIQPGDRIAQACFREVPEVSFEYGTIEKTARGGFGSTGTK